MGQLLENDFNWGIKMDWNNYQIKQKIDSMLSIGFKYDDCCEAIIVTENKSLNAAINYGLLDDDVKKKEYERIKKKLNRMKIRRLKDEDYTNYIKTFKKKEIEEKHNSEEDELVKKWTKKLQTTNKNKNISNKTNEILMEIEKFKKMANALKMHRQKLAEKISQNTLNHKLTLYENYVNGILSAKTLNVEQVSEWKKYRNKHNITDKQHNMILNKFGYKNDDELDAIKTYIFFEPDNNNKNHLEPSQSTTKHVATTCSSSDNECVICYEKIASLDCDDGDTAYMILPCNHICLCQKCANNWYSPPHHSQKCPLGCEQVIDVKKVYFS